MTTEVNSDMNSETNEPIAIIGLAPSYEAFGLILEFLSASSTFGSFDLETISEAIRMQLADEHCLGAMQGKTMVGYAGWLLTTADDGEEWVENRGRLRPLPQAQANAAALTVFASNNAEATKRLIRGARELNKGKRVFFKRSYEGYMKSGRKTDVLNFTRTQEIKPTDTKD